MEAQVAELAARLAERESRPPKTSQISSLPPSSDPPSAPKRRLKRPTGRKRGAQKGHPGHIAYPWLIHRLTYRRTSHDNIHVRGYKEECTITTPFDMTVLNDLDHFHLVMDTIDRLPQTGDKSIYLRQPLKDKLIEHKHNIDKYGEDMPEIRNCKWVRM